MNRILVGVLTGAGAAAAVGLIAISWPLMRLRSEAKYKLVFYVPVADAEYVKEALFAIGVGKLGNYERCSWQVLGDGQFKPLTGATPLLGSVGKLERVPELRVEMLISNRQLVQPAIEALRKAHPYETPAFEVIRVEVE